MIFRGKGGGISRRRQNLKGGTVEIDCQWEGKYQVNFIVTQPKSSDPPLPRQ